MKLKIALLNNTAYNNIKRSELKNLINEYSDVLTLSEESVSFHQESKNYEKYISSLDEKINDNTKIGLNVSDIKLYTVDGGWQQLGGKSHQVIWAYLDSGMKAVKNIIEHELCEHFLKYTLVTDEMRERANHMLGRKLEERYKIPFKNVNDPSAHNILYSLHDEDSDCAMVIDPVNFRYKEFDEKIRITSEKNGLCSDCKERLKKGIQAFLAK